MAKQATKERMKISFMAKQSISSYGDA